MKNGSFAVATIAFGAFGALSADYQAQAAKKIGVADTVVRSVTGEVDRVRQPISTRDEVFLNEVVRTDSRASTRLIFNDRTSLSIGSKSEIVLDEFVYRPGSSASRIVFKTTRGAFRFITGKASKSAYQINTPTATIGVRGTDFDVYVDRFKSSLVLLRGGIVRICRKGIKNIWKVSKNCRKIVTKRNFVLVTTLGIFGPFAWDGKSPMDILYDNRPGRPSRPSSNADDNDGPPSTDDGGGNKPNGGGGEG